MVNDPKTNTIDHHSLERQSVKPAEPATKNNNQEAVKVIIKPQAKLVMGHFNALQVFSDEGVT